MAVRQKIIGVGLSLLLALPAYGEQVPEPDFRPEAMRAHVAFLADDLLEGRDAGTRGYDVAAAYVASQFDGLGLSKPQSGAWMQPIAFKESRLTGTDPAVIIGGQRFENRKTALLGPSLRYPVQSIEAPVVFVGYGFDRPDLGYADYAGLDVKGKYVAVLAGFPKSMASDVGAHLGSEKTKVAEQRGAIGLLTIRTNATERTQPWARMTAFSGRPSITWVEDSGQAHSDAPGIRATATLGDEAANALFAGGKTPLAAIKILADKAGGRPKGFALRPVVRIERESKIGDYASANVIGILPGSDPALAGEYVLLMAHLDHNGVDPTRNADKIFNGAMDNASGVATLIEVAKAMKSTPNRPRRSILFVAVTGEEDGLLGSAYLARHPVVGDGKVVAVVNLDMPILLYDFQDVVAFGAEHSEIGVAVARASQRMGIALSPDPLPEERLFTRSDHYSFVKQGIPSIFLMTGFQNGGEKAFKDFLATHYHKPSDQVDLPFNWNAAAKFARINYLIAHEIADMNAAPRWYKDSFFGDTFAPSAVKAPAPISAKK